jgi:hypothetical protein
LLLYLGVISDRAMFSHSLSTSYESPVVSDKRLSSP